MRSIVVSISWFLVLVAATAAPCLAQIALPKSLVHYGIATVDASGQCKITLMKSKLEARTREETVTTTVTKEIEGGSYRQHYTDDGLPIKKKSWWKVWN